MANRFLSIEGAPTKFDMFSCRFPCRGVGRDFWNHFPLQGFHLENPYLIGGLEHLLFVHSVGNVIIPTDELHHFSEG